MNSSTASKNISIVCVNVLYFLLPIKSGRKGVPDVAEDQG